MMKLVIAILVLLALFTEGKGKSGVQQAYHNNNALNMRRLVKTAVLHQDEALRNSTGTAMPELPESFQFPVVVDLTEFEHKLEQRFDSINENIESLRLKLTELIRCESGFDTYTCSSSCTPGGSIPLQRISFNRAFVNTPTVIIAIQKAVDDSVLKPIWSNVWYGSVSSTEFYIKYYLRPRDPTKPKNTYAKTMWMACGH